MPSPNPKSAPAAEVRIPFDAPSRLLMGAQCALPHLSDEVRAKLAPLLSHETMVIVAGSVMALGVATLAGCGIAVSVVLGVTMVAILGAETIDAFKRLSNFHALCMEAKYAQDFDAAGREFAAFIAIVGVNVGLVLVARRAGIRRDVTNRKDHAEKRQDHLRSHVRHRQFPVVAHVEGTSAESDRPDALTQIARSDLEFDSPLQGRPTVAFPRPAAGPAPPPATATPDAAPCLSSSSAAHR